AAGLLANDSDVDGDALTVRLVDPPSHGTVTLADDGSFAYTPEADYHGADSFTYVASDGASESTVATVAIEVVRSQLAVDLWITGTPFGAEVDGPWASHTFWVSAYVKDLRELPAGVIGGAIDLAYDGLAVVPTGEVVYGEAFSLFQQGEVNPQAAIIDELGALTGTPMVGVGEAAPFVSWQFTRVGTPASFVNTRVEFSTDPGEGTATIDPGNFALAGSGEGVDWLEVKLGSAGVDLAFADFNFDQRVDHFDLALWAPHHGPAAEGVRHDAFFDLNGDNRIDEADLDLLAQAMYGGGPDESAV
ncbi:MAG: Ig-like domain-containing protein, partial [Pirellulales bacterium]|nr:Ig-like domain-containing protein [Pirellulales bacterium]